MGRKKPRGGKPRYMLLSEPTPLGARTRIGWTTFDLGREMVIQGVAEQIQQGDGSIYFQKKRPKVAEQPIVSKASCTALSRAEVELIAGSGFKGGENLAGVVGKLPKQDLVAEARAKLDAFFPVTRTRDGVAA